MKFDSSIISKEKRAEWKAIECQSRPPVRDFEEFNGRRLLWFAGEEIAVDAYVWADCYGMDIEAPDSTELIVAHATRLLGDVRVIFDEPFL